MTQAEAATTEGRPMSVDCRELTVAYGDLVAARNVSFDVGPGEIFGLLGPNGAGKTSVIRALTTVLAPTSGSATIAGVELGDGVAVRHCIGVLPESNGYPGTQTGRGYLRFHGELFGLSRHEAEVRADRLLNQLGLGHPSQRISTYSRGMRQRLGLCRSLINDPTVLFLDEPTLGLDPAGKEDIVAHLAEVAVERGTAVVLCTHLLDEVERVCDRVAILHHGEVVMSGTVDHVVEAADLGGTARLRLAESTDFGTAQQALVATGVVETITHDNSRPGDLDLELVRGVDQPTCVVLGALVRAGVEVRSFDRHHSSLNDAFLALTNGVGAIGEGGDR